MADILERLRTLPELVLAAGLSVDRVREFMRRRADLRALGVRVGPTIGYSPDDAETILREYRAARAGK